MKQTKKQKGGFTYPISNASILNFIKGDTRQHCDRFGVDCGPMILSFIGFSTEEIRQLQEAARRNIGTTIDKVIELIRPKLTIPEGGSVFWEDVRPVVIAGGDIYNTLVSIIVHRSFMLQNNYGYLLFLERPGRTGHFVLLAKINNDVFIFDPQQEKQIPKPICSDEWMRERDSVFRGNNINNNKVPNCDPPSTDSALRFRELVEYFRSQDFQAVKILRATDRLGRDIKPEYTHETITNLAHFSEFPDIAASANNYMSGIAVHRTNQSINNEITKSLSKSITGLSLGGIKKRYQKPTVGKKSKNSTKPKGKSLLRSLISKSKGKPGKKKKKGGSRKIKRNS